MHEMEKAMAPHSSTLAWKVPWTEEPGGLQSMGSLRVSHVISPCSVTVSVHDQPRDQCMICHRISV